MNYGAISNQRKQKDLSSSGVTPSNSSSIDFEIEQDLYQCEETKEFIDLQSNSHIRGHADGADDKEVNFQEENYRCTFDTEQNEGNRFHRSNENLRDTLDTLEKAKLVAHKISDDLDRDRVVLESSRSKLKDSREDGARSKQLLQRIARRTALNKAFLIFIILLLSSIDFFLFYRLVTNKGRL